MQITSFTGTQTYYAQYELVKFNVTSTTNYIGYSNSNALYGYMAEINWIDGKQLTPTSFGYINPSTGVWTPAKYIGGYGTNGFYLNFSDNSNTTAATLGADSSGNGNNWTPNNFSVTAGSGNDSLVDSPTSYGTDTGVGGSVRGNYCTWNFLARGTSGSGFTLSNGNLDGLTPSDGICSVLGTIGVSSGKWYWEVTPTADGAAAMIGVGFSTANLNTYPGGAGSQSWSYYGTGDKYFNNSNSAYGATFTSNDVIGVALDMDAGTLAFYKNGSSQGTAFTGLTGTILPMIGDGGTASAVAFNSNFGQRAFAYTAPSGFKALCTTNLPTPTIGSTSATLANDYFTPITYTGTLATRSVTINFQPDLVWIKQNAARDHRLLDSVRGTNKYLVSNSTAAEGTFAYLNSFDSNGFTLSAGDQSTNGSGQQYIAWNWKAGGTGVSNTAGTVTSTVSANPTSGFSVVTWTGSSAGQTVGHGLGVAPSLIIAKTRSAAGENWPVYHASLGVGNYLFLSSTAAANATYPTYWGSSAPSSTVFGTFTGGYPSANNYGDMVAYCFAPVAGYSAFGSYTGNGSSSGPFIYTGFRPNFVLIKQTTASSTTAWRMVTIETIYLTANDDTAEYTSLPGPISGLANGFRVVGTGGDINQNSSSYIYAAFAEHPFKYALAR